MDDKKPTKVKTCAPLAKLPHDYGIFSAFIAQSPTTLVLRRGMYSSKWKVYTKDAHGVKTKLFHSENKFWSKHSRRQLLLHREAPAGLRQRVMEAMPGVETNEEGHLHLLDIVQNSFWKNHRKAWVIPPNGNIPDKGYEDMEKYVSLEWEPSWLIFGPKASVSFHTPSLAPARADGAPRKLVFKRTYWQHLNGLGWWRGRTHLYEENDDGTRGLLLAKSRVPNLIKNDWIKIKVDVAPGADMLLVVAMNLAYMMATFEKAGLEWKGIGLLPGALDVVEAIV